jgi:hypothetical protein
LLLKLVQSLHLCRKSNFRALPKRGLIEHRSQLVAADRSRALLVIPDVDDIPTSMRDAEQPVDGHAALFEGWADAQLRDCTDSLRLDKQTRAQWCQRWMLLEHSSRMAISREANCRRKARRAGASNADAKYFRIFHAAV